MSFIEIIARHAPEHYAFQEISQAALSGIIAKSRLTHDDFALLLSSSTTPHLELLAKRAKALTQSHFGNSVILFTPMYISNYCTNVCPYCSFARHHKISRKQLSIDEIITEARLIAANGIRHLLVLTGESPVQTPVSYIEEALRAIKPFFASIAIEIFPLTTDEYSRLFRSGADALTLYQETYDASRYASLHTTGPKADFLFRLDAPERACIAGARTVTIGALYGLSDWRNDAFLAGLHADYLQKKYPDVNVAVSFPRLRPQAGEFTPACTVTDRDLVQMIAASRVFLPASGITMSTRESSHFRMNVLPIGITKMSAGVSTSVGGHSSSESTPQFEIADSRDVTAIKRDLLAAGYQPVLHDWNPSFFVPDATVSI